jgi:regulator of replication initiation timing
MKLIVSEAAKQVGKSRNVLYRAIREGRLSVERNSAGIQVIDVSELIRVYGALVATERHTVSETGKETHQKQQMIPDNAALYLELGELRGRVQALPRLEAQLEAAEARAAAAEARAVDAIALTQRLLVDLQKKSRKK